MKASRQFGCSGEKFDPVMGCEERRRYNHQAPEDPALKPHIENLSGTELAYAPPGSIRRSQPVERRDYEAWQPE